MRILIALLAIAAVGAVGWSLRLSRRLRHSERDRRRAADELNRRLSELFSLQELSFILSGSLQLDRIVEQVVRYAMRFLDAQGALVALTLDGEAAGGAGAGREDRPLLQVTAADGTLAALAGRAIGGANARFFEMVRHAKEQWETAFDSLSEGIAVVDDAGRVRRANRSLAAMLGAPIPGVIGRELVEALVGTSPPLVDVLAAARA